MKPSVAVTVSIYGQFEKERLRMAVDSYLLQSHRPLEIIVSEENVEPTFCEDVCKSWEDQE
jgi:hypothetical protein